MAKPYLQTRNNDEHVEKCFLFAQKLLKNELGDQEIVLPAVICHDLGYIKLPQDLLIKAFGPNLDPELQRIHEVEGVKLARKVLNEVGYDPNKIEEILAIIDGHDSRLYALSDNDKIVKDADKLWRFSERGMAIHLGLFAIEPSVYIPQIEKKIAPWFFTETGKFLARNELEDRVATLL